MDTQSGPSSVPSTENNPPTSASGGTTSTHANGSSEANPTFTSAEQDARVEEFFQYWKVPSEDLTNCPTEAVLLEAAKKPDPTDWPEHIQDCCACRELVQLIARPVTERIPAREILADAGRLAWLAEDRTPRRRFTPLKYLQVFYKPLWQAQRTAVVVVLIFALGLASWFAYNRWQSPPPDVVKRNEVQYWKAIEWFDRTNVILSDERLKPHEKVAQLQALKSQKTEIEAITNSLDLDDTQRAELAKRQATYNNQTTILTAALDISNPQPEDLPFTQTQDSKTVTQVWAAFGALDGKTITLDRQDTETAKALLVASECTDITKITQDQSKTTVTVSFPDTDVDQHKPEVQRSISLLENSGVHVTVVPFDESTRPFKARKATKLHTNSRD